MPEYEKCTIGPAISTGMNQGDKGPLELRAERAELGRRRLMKDLRNHAEGKISDMALDSAIHRANYSLDREDLAQEHETNTSVPIDPNKPNPTLIP